MDHDGQGVRRARERLEPSAPPRVDAGRLVRAFQGHRDVDPNGSPLISEVDGYSETVGVGAALSRPLTPCKPTPETPYPSPDP